MMNDPIFNIELYTTCMDTHLSNALNPSVSQLVNNPPPAFEDHVRSRRLHPFA